MITIEKMETSERYCTVIYCVCAYCHRFLGTKDGGGICGTSHGICKTCRQTFLTETSPKV